MRTIFPKARIVDTWFLMGEARKISYWMHSKMRLFSTRVTGYFLLRWPGKQRKGRAD